MEIFRARGRVFFPPVGGAAPLCSTDVESRIAAVERQCLGCGVIGDFGTYQAKGKPQRYPRCLDCRRARKREQHAQLSARLGHRVVDGAPDRQPAETMRQELGQLRAQGFPFERAWKVALMRATSELEPPDERASWLQALRGSQQAWEAGYERLPVSGGELADLLAV